MEIVVNKQALSDAPYQEGNEGICTFDQNQIENFACELIYGNQTCYLVSGYRGVGKTSFINKVRQIVEDKAQKLVGKELKDQIDKSKPETYRPVFVYSSFAKYNNQTAFLRQIIRNLFLAFEETKVKDKSLISQLDTEVEDAFTTLNQRTFFDVKTQYEISNESTIEQSIGIKTTIGTLITGIFKAILPVPAILLGERIIKYFNYPLWVSAILLLGCIGWYILSLIQISAVKSERGTKRESKKTGELYDDEIAAHHFEKILKKLKKEGYKIVFILDELDKVNAAEIAALINEMKPYLLSGLADFIVVAGQQLTYKYVSAFSEDDDEVVGSLFSKVFHVPLKHTRELHSMVKEKILNTANLDQSQLTQLDESISRYILQSRRIPRILINQIRQNIVWKKDSPYLVLSGYVDSEKYKGIIKAIEGIIEDTIDPRGHKEVVRDYLIVQLYTTAGMLETHSGKRIKETEILGKFQKSTFFHHPLYFNELAPCIEKLITRLEKVLKVEVIRDSKPADDFAADPITTTENKGKEQPSFNEISSIALAKSLEAFKEEVDECAWVMRVTYLALGKENSEVIHKYTSYDLLEKLIKEKFLHLDLPKDSQFQSFLASRDILENSETLQLAYKIARDARIDFNTIALNVLEEYLRRALRKVFPDFTAFEFPNDIGPDFLLQNEVSDFPDLLLDFKFLKSEIINLKVPEISRRLIEHNVKTGKGNFCALVVFTSEAKESYATERFRIKSEARTVGTSSNGSAVNLDDELTIIVLSIQYLTRIFDELIFLKNAMCAYEIDSSGIPTYPQIGVSPNRAFKFKNQFPLSNDPGRNDHLLPAISKSPSELVVKIQPENSQYWRCGLKFSADGTFPKFQEGRHVAGYPDIHISVGEPQTKIIEDGKYVWGSPKTLKITNYFIEPAENDWSFNQYNGGTVILRFSFEQEDRTVVKVYVDGAYINTFTYKDSRLKFYKISGWADTLDFTLNTQILVNGAKEPYVLQGGDITLAAAGHASSSITGKILQEPDGIFSIWAFVDDAQYKIVDSSRNMYLAGYASNNGKDLGNPSAARYPNTWSIYRSSPTKSNQTGTWIFHCNGIEKDATQLATSEMISNGWHLFSVAWSTKSNYIYFLIDTKVVDQSSFANWPSHFAHSIHLGTWPSRAPEFYFNSRIGRWHFTNIPYNEEIIEKLMFNKPTL